MIFFQNLPSYIHNKVGEERYNIMKLIRYVCIEQCLAPQYYQNTGKTIKNRRPNYSYCFKRKSSSVLALKTSGFKAFRIAWVKIFRPFPSVCANIKTATAAGA